MIRSSLLVLLFFFISVVPALAQAKKITGTVRDESGAPLAGATLSVKGTATTVLADTAGRFTVQASENDILNISSVGYQTQEVAAGASVPLDVILKQADHGMDEVVIVGYGVQKRAHVAGAVDQIKGDQIAKRPVSNLVQGLQGLSPNLNIGFTNGAPGTQASLNIRGLTSINGGEPLIVIDGSVANSGDLYSLNQNDVETITVLRDAASAAIYGGRASFGVILVTTKSGKMGKTQVSYSNFFTKSRQSVTPVPITDPYVYSRLLQISTENTPWKYVKFDDEYYKWAKDRSENPSLPAVRVNPKDATAWQYMGNTNWADYFFNKSSFSQQHTVTFSGGTGRDAEKPIHYYVSAGFTKENGLLKLARDDWRRFNTRAKVDFKPFSWLKIENNMQVYQTDRVAPNVLSNPNNFGGLFNLVPTDVAQNPDGTWANTSGGRLAAAIQDGGRNGSRLTGFQDIPSFTATFLKGDLIVRGQASIRREMNRLGRYSKSYQVGYGPNDVREQGDLTGSVYESTGILTQDIYDLNATYNKKLGDHAFTVLAGYNQENWEARSTNVNATGLISPSAPFLELTTGPVTKGAGYSAYAIQGVFGRINYNYKEKYGIEGNARYDGSSRFLPGDKWGFFPSVAGYWNLHKEGFFEGPSKVLTNFKLRSSYGWLGNQNVPLFRINDRLDTRVSGYLIGGNIATVAGTAPQLRINPNTFSWEKVGQLNLGADITVLNRVSASFDYYFRNTTDMIYTPRVVPAVMGTSAPPENNADLQTKGWELTLTYNNNFDVAGKPLSVNAKVILSDNQSRITKVDNEQQDLSRWRVGQDPNAIYGLVSDGFFKNTEEIAALDESGIVPWGSLDIIPGWMKFVDQDKNGRIEKPLTGKDMKDYVVIGNSNSRYRYGVNLDFSWNNIDLSVFLQGVGKKDYYPADYLFWGAYQQPYANYYPWLLDFYRATPDDAATRAKHSAEYIRLGLADQNLNSRYPVLQSWLADNRENKGLDIPQTGYLLNAAYLRVKNLTLGYTLPQQLTGKIGMSSLRLFVTGENLFEFTKMDKFFDPEAIDTDGYSYPFMRKYSCGLQINF
ncbi:SusC/RagA family TonB-linked outer membrane protein [Niabella hirudinis]|uniref:SusC/RagA family TonB-linked outer membrane protein n=1 Tax=Niabella hirudinis TaxID=1285929 RepID=UPI003EB7E6BF